MKVWIEFPEETRFARQPRDILYTPIYFANEKISAHVRLDKEWQSVHGDELDREFHAVVRLVGKASLGFLSIGGRPVGGIDMRYSIPSLGFRPIYTLEILNMYRRVTLANLEYDVDDGVRGGKVPFAFQLPTSTLEDIQQLASSLKVITADNISTMGFLKGVTPALIVSVQYVVVAEIVNRESEIQSSTKEEVRIFVSLTEEQVPPSSHPSVESNPMAKFVRTQVISLNPSRTRRNSIPLIRRLSRTSSSSAQESSLMTIEIESAEPFTFTRNSDAAASKVTIALTYTSDTPDPPPQMECGIQWHLKSLTSLTLEPIERDETTDQPDDFFHLRSKVLPYRKLKLRMSDWTRQPESTSSRIRWKSSSPVYLVKDISDGMTPTFITPYLCHTYALNMQISVAEVEYKVGRIKQRVELEVPVSIRYDLGLVPSYEVDQSLPEYDHTLPEYDEIDGNLGAGGNRDGVGEGAELPDLSALNLDLSTTREEGVPDGGAEGGGREGGEGGGLNIPVIRAQLPNSRRGSQHSIPEGN